MKLRLGHGEKPLWSQLYDILEEQILSGNFKTGDIIPSEKELMELYEVSRVTVRQAMDKLIVAGYIVRNRGKGTSVINNDNNVTTSFQSSFNGVKEKNNNKDRRVVCVELVHPTVDVAYFFDIYKDDMVIKLIRQTYVDEKLMTHYETYINPVVGIDVNTNLTGSMYDCFDEKGYRITRVKEKITASVMSVKEKKLFGLTKSEALMNRIRMGYCGDIPIEFTYSKYVAKGYELEIELS